jgi:hypothetical protein
MALLNSLVAKTAAVIRFAAAFAFKNAVSKKFIG